MSEALPVAAFASGGGTNLQALLDYEAEGAFYRVALVISDREGAGALDRARSRGREARVIPVSGRTASDVAQETLEALGSVGARAILLAGYLRLIPEAVVDAFPRRILNVHPALLPAFGGKGMYGRHVHQAVLDAGVSVTGSTVHFADAEYDTGSIVAQWPVPVHTGDTPETLAARVLAVEHRLYPVAADELARAILEDRPVRGFRPPTDAFGPADAADSTSPETIRSGFSGA